MQKIKDRVWFITGISTGLGCALAEAVLKGGGTVVGTTRSGKADLAVGGGKLHVLPLEVTDASQTRRVVEQAHALQGRLDVVVNNAGYGLLGSIEEATDEEAAHVFAVNFFGPLRVIQAVLPLLRAQGHGHIVNVTSIAGRAPMASSGLYAAAKSALEGLSISLAQEVGVLGIKVTAVAPGGFRTAFLAEGSIRRSQATVPAYEATVGKALAHLDEIAGKQMGDPARGAQAIIAAVQADEPPLHLLLGSDAFGRARAKLDATAAEIARWETTTTGTDFPEGAQ